MNKLRNQGAFTLIENLPPYLRWDVLTEKFGGGVRSASQNAYPIYLFIYLFIGYHIYDRCGYHKCPEYNL